MRMAGSIMARKKPEKYKQEKIDTSNSNVLKIEKVPTGIYAQNSDIVLEKYEFNIDRRGSIFKNFRLKKSEPELCRKACIDEPKCKAWSYGKPGYFSAPNGRCWLSWKESKPKKNEHCISGVKHRRISNMEFIEINVDYASRYYTQFTLPREDPKLCLAACSFDEMCVAWTYAKPIGDERPFPQYAVAVALKG